jgi:ADP-ribosylglycohydrolase/sugar/nucleoside kinase (ribokinase family)
MKSSARARGALYGLAIGDALGMPTQMLSRAEITRRWGGLLSGFEPAPPGHPIAAGLPAGTVTDDTEQAVLLGRLLVTGKGTVDSRELADALVRWERDMAERGSLDLLGPSTKRAVAAVLAGTPPEEAGASGDTNGAAMRIAPVGIASADLSTLIDRVVEASLVTHNTGIALAGAAAVAAAVSAGVSGAGIAGVTGATALAIEAARIAAGRGHWIAGADVAARIEWATGLIAGRSQEQAAELIYTLVGTSLATQESVPAAFAVLAAVPDDPWQACLLAASLGGDCDTIAAMTGAIAGACYGVTAFPPEAIAVIDAQGLDLAALADDLFALRSPTAQSPGHRRGHDEPATAPATGPATMNQPPSQPPLNRLLFAGEAIVDLLMWVPALPERGGDMLAESSAVQVGGGFNIMAAAVRQGLRVLYCGGHGTGPWGEKVRAALAAEDIGLLRAPDPDADTGFDVALVEADGERTFITHLGAESLRDPDAWDLVLPRPGDAVYVSGYGLVAPASGAILGAWAAALPAGVLLFVDPGPLVADIPAPVLDPVLARCDWWSCNQREAALLTGSSDPAEAARRLIGRTGQADVIVRAGPDGCVLALRDSAGLSHIPAPAVTAVDTTGAGDAHSGVFLAALAAGLTVSDAARRANAAAALAVTRFGAAVSPSRAELDQFLATPGLPH